MGLRGTAGKPEYGEVPILGKLPKYHDDMATRKLCGHLYRDTAFAADVLDMFLTDKLRARSRPVGIDLVAMLRHAGRAQRLHLARDAMLTACLATLVAGVVGLVATIAVADWNRGRLATFLLMACYALLASIPLVYVWGWVLWRGAQRVQWGDATPREGAAVLDEGLEAELDALDDANVVAYTTSFGEHPFVGSGIEVMETVWAGIDVSRPAKGGRSDGKNDGQGDGKNVGNGSSNGRLTIKPFDAVDLHAYVAEHAAEFAGLDGLRASNRLYVRGHHVRDLGTALLPDPLKRPLTRIDPALVEAGITETGNVMRTYLSLELIGASGSYVATVFLRARLFHSRLSWELSAYYLPPVYAFLGDESRQHFGVAEQAWKLLPFTVKHLRPQLLGSVGRLARRPVGRLGSELRHALDRHRITRRRGLFDYGTAGTLRAAASDPDRTEDYIQRMDATDAFQRIQQAVLLATERFLKDHNVDTSDLKQARRTVNNQTYNFTGPVTGQNIFGDHGINAIGQGGGKPPGGGNGPAGSGPSGNGGGGSGGGGGTGGGGAGGGAPAGVSSGRD